MRQMVEKIANGKKKKSAPTKMAPITLVAGNPIRRRIIATKIVPAIPKSRADKGVQHRLQEESVPVNAVVRRTTARYTTAIPNATME